MQVLYLINTININHDIKIIHRRGRDFYFNNATSIAVSSMEVRLKEDKCQQLVDFGSLQRLCCWECAFQTFTSL